jgi:galactose-1-phosphate uridylyltransferase
MNSSNIKNLINYAYKYLDLNVLDELYVRNRLLEACFMEEYDENDDSNLVDVNDLDYPDSIINPILDDLILSGKIKEEQREY